MKGKHAQKNFGAIGAMARAPLSLKTRGQGERGGGGLGDVTYEDRARPPPPPPPVVAMSECCCSKLLSCIKVIG